MPENIGATFVRNDVKGVALLVMGREDLKDIGLTKSGPLDFLLKDITNLCRENKSEAIFIDHSAYCFQKILDTLWLRSMCHSEEKPPFVYIQVSQQERFKKIVEYYFTGEYSSFILQRGDINSTILSKHNSSQIESWLSEDGVSGYLELLYQGLRDGWKVLDFHVKCDNKGATITVIWITDSFIFGVFADKPWTSSGEWCKSDKALFFTLKSPSNEVGPIKMSRIQKVCSNTMYHYYSYGPTFGGAHDLYTHNDANNNINSYSILGHTYELHLDRLVHFWLAPIISKR